MPKLAEQEQYIGSESTIYRVLREAKQLTHRASSKPRTHKKPREYRADGPRQVWTWDITYLPTTVRGLWFYLYLVVDIWSRKIVGWNVHTEENGDKAALLARAAMMREGNPQGLVWHSDNGSPMKAATLLATLLHLGVVASFSRPHVSDDNPFSESLFRTLKYRPEYPSQPFDTLEEARAWVQRFVAWYNNEHLHSAIGYVAPADRHNGDDLTKLEARRRTYERARAEHPERWTGKTRPWDSPEIVHLNPTKETRKRLSS